MLSRRDLVGKLAAGTAAVCAVGVARAGFASSDPRDTAKGANRTAAGAAQPAGAQSSQPGESRALFDAEAPSTLAAERPWALLRPLSTGSSVGHGWHVADLTGAANGSCVLTLENARGRSHRVHICRNDGSPQGLVYTTKFDLVVMNGGAGDLPTEEGFAQAVAEVAHVLAANERQGEAIVPQLLAHNERVQRFSGAEDRRLR